MNFKLEWKVLLVVLLLAGCSSREARGRSAADVWHIGHALENHHADLPPATLVLMGQSLKAVATKWADSLKVEIKGE